MLSLLIPSFSDFLYLGFASSFEEVMQIKNTGLKSIVIPILPYTAFNFSKYFIVTVAMKEISYSSGVETNLEPTRISLKSGFFFFPFKLFDHSKSNQHSMLYLDLAVRPYLQRNQAIVTFPGRKTMLKALECPQQQVSLLIMKRPPVMSDSRVVL